MMAVAMERVTGNEDPLKAETYALKMVVKLAMDSCFKRIIFKSDNETLVRMMNDKEKLQNMSGLMCKNIKRNLNWFKGARVVHT